jgi:hypothetical protein
MSQSFLLQGSQSSLAPVMSWGGSLVAGQPFTWQPLPPAGFGPPQGAGFWRSLPPTRSRLLADAYVVGTSTWRKRHRPLEFLRG